MPNLHSDKLSESLFLPICNIAKNIQDKCNDKKKGHGPETIHATRFIAQISEVTSHACHSNRCHLEHNSHYAHSCH